MIISVRPATPADVAAATATPSNKLSRVREVHHSMAKMFVAGLNNNEVAERLGYSISRVSIIRNSPAFQELIARYREVDNTAWVAQRDDYWEDIRAAGRRSIRKIIERLDADDDNEVTEIPLRDLLKIHDSTADRVGYHRKSTKENINIDFAARLEAAISRSRKVLLIDGEAE